MITTDFSAQIRSFSRTYTAKLGLLSQSPYDVELNLMQSRIVFELHHRRQMLAKDLAETLKVNKGYLSRSLSPLVKKKIVVLHENKNDKREKILKLSPHGESLFKKINQSSLQSINQILQPMPFALQNSLVQSLSTADLIFSDTPLRQDEIVFRNLEPGDLGWVIGRHGEIYHQEFGWNHEFEVLVADIATTFAKNYDRKKERAWIAEARGVRLGCVFLVKENKDTAKLRILLVEPMARGAGVGSGLVKECLKFAKKSGYKKMILWTNDILISARKIYVAEGFRLTKEEPHQSFGKKLVGQYWEKDL